MVLGLDLDKPIELLPETHQQETMVHGIKWSFNLEHGLKTIMHVLPGIQYNVNDGLRVIDKRIRITLSRGNQCFYTLPSETRKLFCKKYNFYWNDKQVVVLNIEVYSWSSGCSLELNTSNINHEKLRLITPSKIHKNIDDHITKIILTFVS
jgi:hypothetical protein